MYTQGEVTSHNLWSQNDRHFVGITRHNVWSQGAKIYCLVLIKLNQLIYDNVRVIINFPTKRI